jgi:hypothetical protein
MNYEKESESVYEDANSNIDPKYFEVSKPGKDYVENFENEINYNKDEIDKKKNSENFKSNENYNLYENPSERKGKDFVYSEPIAFIEKERVSKGCCKDNGECNIL